MRTERNFKFMTTEKIKSHLEVIKIDPEIKKDKNLLKSAIHRYTKQIQRQEATDHKFRLKARKLKDYTKKG